MEKLKEYVVYALLLNKECVYVGCTSILKNRLCNHKISKSFDSHVIISRHSDKNEALLAERSIVEFLSIFGSDKLYNGKYSSLTSHAQIKLGLQTDINHY